MGKRSGDRQPGGQDTWQGSGPHRPSHICAQINQDEQQGSKTDLKTQDFNAGNYRLKTPGCKNSVGVGVAGETPSLT